MHVQYFMCALYHNLEEYSKFLKSKTSLIAYTLPYIYTNAQSYKMIASPEKFRDRSQINSPKEDTIATFACSPTYVYVTKYSIRGNIGGH